MEDVSESVLGGSEGCGDCLSSSLLEHVGGQHVGGSGRLGHLDDVCAVVDEGLGVCLADGCGCGYPLVDLLRGHHHSEDQVLGGDHVSGEGERSGGSGDDAVVLTVGFLQELAGFDDLCDTSSLEELVDGHHCCGVVVYALHAVELERVVLDHGCRVLLVGGDGASEPLGLGGQAEGSPAALESEPVGLCGSELCHDLGVLVSLGPCGAGGIHLSDGCGLGEDGRRGPVEVLFVHSCGYSFSGSHCHDINLLGSGIP